MSGIGKFFAVCLAFSCAACADMPAAGPQSWDVKAGHPTEPEGLPYGLVKITPQTVAILHEFEPKGLAGTFTDRRPPSQLVFGVGDTVSVTIFEAAAGGLFIPQEAGVRPGNFVTIPDQPVDNNGNITVPYAGEIKAAGRTNVQIQQDIINRIKNRAIEPQAVVSLSRQSTSLVSVLGEVNTPVRYPAAPAGADDRILDAITRAGGIKGQGYESWVMLERHGKRATVPFENLVMEPGNNIYVQPGDRVYVYREQQKFLALGATGQTSNTTGQSGEFNFDAWRINLAEAVGKAGGLIDAQADPDAVFLYRAEPRDVAERLGVDMAKFPGAATIPVIFSINLRDPGGFFLATKVQMKNGDIIFVSNARSVEVTKFLQYLSVIMATTNNAITTTNNGIILRNNIKALMPGGGTP
jgi:polysaccharide export outer membrane protein